ncbi:MAG: branched-chain amino acid ABC transporter permease [Clostridiales bacterium]|nr:branched-chain amino acid ABC transporter permease [Clostridiales bacterium]
MLTLIVGALMQGSVYGLVGMGYGLIYKASGLMTLAQGDMIMIGAFLGMTFYKYMGLPFGLSLALVMIIMFTLGFLIERILVTSLLAKGAAQVYVILCTIAISMILQNGAMFAWGSNVMQFQAILDLSISIIANNDQADRLQEQAVGIFFMLLLHFFMQHTKFGTSMRAAAQDETAAEALGINVPLTKGTAWGLASMLAGVAGVILGPSYGVYTAMGALIGQKAFAASVAGGYGNMYGAIVGGIFLGFVEAFSVYFVSSLYKDFIAFGILILVMIFMPNGLFNEQVME